MAVVVQKYGGSSVADIDKLGQVADQVVAARAAGHDVVVVVSAMGKTTDNLLELARRAASVGDASEPEPAKRELDMLVSTGERVSMSLLSIAIQARGHDAVSFTGSQSGIITNDRHFDARIIEVKPHRIEDELARGRIVIVAGYQGMSYKREITTLGRGGSDTTAVALAAALGAERCEIYSDVDGVYSADPRVISDARHLPALDYETMQEMAEVGAKVLNAQAVEWARRNQVTIVARRTGDRSATARESLVSSTGGHALAVVSLERIAALQSSAGELGSVLEATRALGLPLCDVVAGTELWAWWSVVNVPGWGDARGKLARVLGAASTVHDGLGAVSLVGVEAGTRPDRVQGLLEAAGGALRALFVHPLRATVLLESAAVVPCAQRLHARVIGGEA